MPVTLKQALDFVMPDGKRYGACKWRDIPRLSRDAEGMPGFQDAIDRITYTMMDGEVGDIDIIAGPTATLEEVIKQLLETWADGPSTARH